MVTSGMPSWSDSAAKTSRVAMKPRSTRIFADLLAALLLQFERAFQIFLRDLLPLDQHFAETAR